MDRYGIKNNPISNFKMGLDTHSFNVSLASRFGLIEAIIIQHSYYWYGLNKDNPDMTKDGKVWFFRSVSQIAEVYPYLTVDKVRRTIDRLVEVGILIKGNYSSDKFKKANWYSLSDEMINIMKGENAKSIQQNAEPLGKMPNDSAKCQLSYSIIDNKEEDNKTKEDTNVSKKDRDLLFEECWALYGRRGSKGKSKEIWNKLNDDELRLIKPHIQAYVQSVSDKKYQKWFERYLRDKSFQDVVYKGNMIIFDPERENATDNEYRPQLDGFNLHWNEQSKCYISMYDIDMLFDGYNANNRPSSAMVMKNGVRYKWNTQTKKWEVQ